MTAALLGLVVAGAGSMPATASDGATDAQVDALAAGWRNGKGAAAEGVAGAVMMEYGETQPVLKCKVLNICTVRLRPGEVLTEAPTVGDSVRWSVAVRAGGNGRDKVVYVVVKPASTAEETSMFITTNERAYHIELHPSDTNYTPLLAFTYPEDREAENARRVAAMQAEAAQTERVAAQRAVYEAALPDAAWFQQQLRQLIQVPWSSHSLQKSCHLLLMQKTNILNSWCLLQNSSQVFKMMLRWMICL
jgi:P-type conjugative transfer protein TrbG